MAGQTKRKTSLEVKHNKALDFRTIWCDGATISAPVGPNNNASLTFYVDQIEVTSERMTILSEDSERIVLTNDPQGISTVRNREEQVRLLFSISGLLSLGQLVQQRIELLRGMGLVTDASEQVQ